VRNIRAGRDSVRDGVGQELDPGAWREAFAAAYAARERCSPEQARFAADVMQPVLGNLDVPAAIDFVLADRGIKDAVVSEFRRTRS